MLHINRSLHQWYCNINLIIPFSFAIDKKVKINIGIQFINAEMWLLVCHMIMCGFHEKNVDIKKVKYEQMNCFRYGGWSFEGSTIDPEVTIWWNSKGWHSLPAYFNALSNMILRSQVPPQNRGQYGELETSLLYITPLFFNSGKVAKYGIHCLLISMMGLTWQWESIWQITRIHVF